MNDCICWQSVTLDLLSVSLSVSCSFVCRCKTGFVSLSPLLFLFSSPASLQRGLRYLLPKRNYDDIGTMCCPEEQAAKLLLFYNGAQEHGRAATRTQVSASKPARLCLLISASIDRLPSYLHTYSTYVEVLSWQGG